MNRKQIALSVVVLLFASCGALADRTLERAEILQIFQELTRHPQKTWIPAGTIKATHTEYRAQRTTDPNKSNSIFNQKAKEWQVNSNRLEQTECLQKTRPDAAQFNACRTLAGQYTMISSVVVRFDGERFYWEINVDSRTDSAGPDRDLSGNFATRRFDLPRNARRIFAWDGEEYATYFVSGNHVTVDAAGATPHAVNGPLTAGIIPWGYGYCTYEELSASESCAIETKVNGQRQIRLEINNSDGTEMTFILDPARSYAALSYSIVDSGGALHSGQFSDYQLVAGNWVPATVVLEKYEATSNRLQAADSWKLTTISGEVPGPESFSVEYEDDALVEYQYDLVKKPVTYRYSDMVDTDLLLAERLSIAASEGIRSQNCASTAMKYVVSRLGKEVTDQQLAELASQTSRDTSLHAMKAFAEGLGLHCRAIKTNVQTLKMLGGHCQIILHIPQKKHFVVLGGIDNDSVWTIDLANNKFFYSTDLSYFGADWSEGTALVISNQPIQLPGGYTEIDSRELDSVVGASGYTCTNLLQEYYIVHCVYLGGCNGWFEVHYRRYGCEAAPSGSCSNDILLRYMESPCIDDPYYPGSCDITGIWTSYYMRACD